MSKLAKALTAAAGNAGESLYVEDVFSTYLYTGTGAAQTITNGIDLAGEGGLVWIKKRNSALKHLLYDTNRGVYKDLNSDDASGEDSAGNNLTAFNSDGFSIGNGVEVSSASDTRASWTFRKAEKFFDVVTWTGDGVAGRAIAHNLGSVPAVIMTKRYDASGAWWTVYHKNSPNSVGWLNEINAFNGSDMQYYYGNGSSAVTPTSSVFTVSDNANVNGSSATYVAYLFASDAGGFGDDGSENIIKCGSFTTDSSAVFYENLGFEPQWVLVKRSDGTGAWNLLDNMRGFLAEGTANGKYLRPNTSGAEGNLSSSDSEYINATGFGANGNGVTGSANATYIYIAIRRPMKTPESGTEVFAVDTYNQTSASDPAFNLGAVVDFGLRRINNFESNWTAQTRLTGDKGLTPNATDAESTQNYGNWDNMVGWYQGASITPPYSQANWYGWSFKRATGFMDVVAYTGTGVARTVSHNLGAVPELMILKVRNRAGSSWVGYHKDLGNEGGFDLTSSAAFSGVTSAWNSTTPNSSVFTVGTGSNYNGNTDNLIAYLFATLAGVSKVGSYTGTGSNVDVNCGFSAGARFILIKRTDSTGDWYVYDSVRGIVAGNDPYLLLNSSAAEVTSTDYIDPLSSGFTVTSSAPAALNASGGNYIFLAIA